MKRVAISQSNYIPWKGYFDLVASVDEFVIYDEVQYTRRDWRNRNQIKTPGGLQWLSVPAKVKGRYDQRINEVEIDQGAWQLEHWKAIHLNYKKSQYFDEVASLLQPIYLSNEWSRLSVLNKKLINEVCRYLEIDSRISDSVDYVIDSVCRTSRLVSICEQLGAECYVSGPAAQAYLDESMFLDKDIAVEWFDYSGYPGYPQLWGEFMPHVSVVDLLFNCGKESPKYMKHVQIKSGNV